jgi:hypothetical protein
MERKSKPKTPYQRMLEDFREYAMKVRSARRVLMWVYPKDRLNNSWTLGDLNERVKAADQLGYDVIVEAKDEGLRVVYRKRAPEAPYYV